jgi:protein-tyrosine phosphatase
MAYRVLFVCTGNVCRSPAAERLLRRRVDTAAGGFGGPSGVDISSAGTGALVGEPISPPMAALIRAEGADAEDFAARQLTPSLVRAADLVIAMSSEHRRATVTLVPAAVQRTFVLGELEHMLGNVDADEVTAAAGEGASTADRLRAVVTVAKRHRTPGVDPAEDVVDPYGRSKAVYAESFAQIQAALSSLVRVVVPARHGGS